MTAEQRKEIVRLRGMNMSYSSIANLLGVSKDTIKTFCRRTGIGGARSENKHQGNECPLCGRSIIQTAGRKPKRFCSDKCRQVWWASHPDRINRKAVYSFNCQGCGKPFTAYGNSDRKYCSHECYIKTRFKGEGRSDT